MAECVVQCERPREQARGELRSVTAVQAKQAGEQVIWEQRGQQQFGLQSRNKFKEEGILSIQRSLEETARTGSQETDRQKDREHLDQAGH